MINILYVVLFFIILFLILFLLCIITFPILLWMRRISMKSNKTRIYDDILKYSLEHFYKQPNSSFVGLTYNMFTCRMDVPERIEITVSGYDEMFGYVYVEMNVYVNNPKGRNFEFKRNINFFSPTYWKIRKQYSNALKEKEYNEILNKISRIPENLKLKMNFKKI